MNALGQRIARLIQAQGPISIAQYMTMALHDPQAGYYATRDPFGARGDFITAPEISQMFGELLGLWIAQCWHDQGKPDARLVELGPGRGTLMSDALRAIRQLMPGFLASVEIVLVENSPALTAIQKKTLAQSGANIRWAMQFDDMLADKPLFLLANEFFDALPIHQFVKTQFGWCERMVVEKDGALDFALTPDAAPTSIAPAGRAGAPIGGFYETSPASVAIVRQIGATIARKGGAALIVDYGYGADAGFGETLQALTAHKYASVLEAPGEADLTAHVDFAALAEAAQSGGAKTIGPIPQGEFLKSLGIVPRAAALAQGRTSSEIDRQLERLILPDQMGTLFKVLAILPPVER
ncbi:MAG TPA: SAM-dependent methyltransferase [Rhizomicrobium sp.]|nr:SAM-dependent methyltransferase [Rhizomicrobium sp.]